MVFPAHGTMLEEAIFEDAKVDDESGRDHLERFHVGEKPGA